MNSAQTNSLEDILLQEKIITPDQADLIRAEKTNSTKSVDQILLDRGFAKPQDIIRARSVLFKVPFVDINTKPILPQVLNLIPQPVAQTYLAVAFEQDPITGTISVALANPLDLAAISFIETKTQKRVKSFLADPDAIRNVISERYDQALSTEISQALKESPITTDGQDISIETAKTSEIIQDAPVTKIVTSLFDFAVKARASDIHIEPLETNTRIRYRIDGILYEKLILPRKIHDSLVSRVKIMSNLKIDERRIPQDGRFNYHSGNSDIDVRVSTLPTVFGEKIVMRLLPKGGGVPTFAALGLRGMALKNLEISILRPHGIIIICGPTGSGKTTTLYSVLSRINSAKVNIVTVEDPVEYQIPGINQVQINSAAGITFATGLRAFLRQDPNVILVGEIRDHETTDLAVQAALTGHLVFSTLHTSNASGSIPRLLDLAAEPFLLASSLNAVVGQRILRKICPDCKESYEVPEILAVDIKNVLGNLLPQTKIKEGKLFLYRGKGCKECGDSGFLGRIGIFEVLPVSDKIAKLILAHSSADEVEKQAVEEGMITMKQDGYLKAVEGVTTIEEVLRVAQD